MNYKISPLNNNERQIDFELTASEMKIFVDQALENLAKDLEINGFRKGKVPKEIAEKHLEASKIWEEAAILAIKKNYNDILEKENLKVIDRPQITITKLAPENDFSFKAKVTVLPEIILPDNYKKLAQEILKKDIESEVTDEEIQEVLAWFQSLKSQLKELDRPAQKGDILEIDFQTFCENIPLEGGSGQNHRFVLGSNHFLAGFEEQLINARKGEIKKFSLEAPPDWPVSHLRGKKLDFEVKIKLVAEKALPAIDDQLAQQIGAFKNLEELKNKIRADLSQAKRAKAEEKNKIEFLDRVSEKITLDLPTVLIEAEVNKMIEEFKNSLIYEGLDYETYLKSLNKTEAELKNEFRPEAEKRIKYAMILEAIADANDIMVSETEIESALKNEMIKRDQTSQIDSQDLRSYIKGRLRYDKVFKFLMN